MPTGTVAKGRSSFCVNSQLVSLRFEVGKGSLYVGHCAGKGVKRGKAIRKAHRGEALFGIPGSFFVVAGAITTYPASAMEKDNPGKGLFKFRGDEVEAKLDSLGNIGLRGQNPHPSSLAEGRRDF